MPDTPSIVIAKSFEFRGTNEIWTNKYHFEGDTPSSRADWLALLRAIWEGERTFMGSDVSLAGGSCYVAGNEAAAQMFDVTQIGGTGATNVGAMSSAQGQMGDVSMWVRWGTTERNSKNKPIYLRKYFHSVPVQTANGDVPSAAARTAALAYAAKMYDGSLPGGVKVCGPQGADAVSHAVAQWFTTRTLKRNARTPI